MNNTQNINIPHLIKMIDLRRKRLLRKTVVNVARFYLQSFLYHETVWPLACRTRHESLRRERLCHVTTRLVFNVHAVVAQLSMNSSMATENDDMRQRLRRLC